MLLEVQGLGEKRVNKFQSCWQGQKAIREVMILLQNYGVSPTYAQKNNHHYKENSLNVIRENPYQLATDISGIGFKKADEIAKKGFTKESEARTDSGILYVFDRTF